uniref:Uncharacterized protein n=1 Tax=Cyanothece sp. (strain PCC 7425 / ATCC 29141) TaxID=395961 RepID=B8HTI8_CYAP4
MSAALKPNYYPHDEKEVARERRRLVEQRRQKLQAKVEPFVLPPQPRWLTALIRLQHVSTAGTLLIVGALLPLYGWGSLTQHNWGKRFSELEHLQRQERQLLADREMRKYQVAEQAERQPLGLVREVPGNTLFLPTAAVKTPSTSADLVDQPAAPLPVPSPISY